LSWRKRRDHILLTLDIRKAFDTVWREGLIYKLFIQAKITGPIGLLIVDYLSDRSTQVRVNNTLSDPFPMPNGVPQGGVLSPLLFLIYVNDLSNNISNDVPCPQLADDTSVHTDIPRRSSPMRVRKIKIIQGVLNQLSKWFNAWRLNLSHVKTKLRVLSQSKTVRSKDLIFTLNGETITTSTEAYTRFLGVRLDNKLHFRHHATHGRTATASRISVLKSISNSSWGAHYPSKLIIYKSWIRPVYEYGLVCTSTADMASMKIWNRIQRSALMVVLSARNTVSLPAMEVLTSTEPVELRRYHRWATLSAKLTRAPSSPLVVA
jgi:hypothetical protein